jgi:nitrilase
MIRRASSRRLLVYGPTVRASRATTRFHLFRFSQGDENYDEAKTICAGSAARSFVADCGRIALSICYDVPFPELYRSSPMSR